MLDIPGYTVLHTVVEHPPVTVLRAVRRLDQSPVIIKLLALEYPTAAQLARIRREYELVRRLDLACVVRFLSLERVGHSLAIVMEDCGTSSLRELINSNALILADKIRLAHSLAMAADDIHRSAIIHKDLNPNNILVADGLGRIKIIDFGAASELPRETARMETPDRLAGTLAYIAPEQTGRMNRPIDYRSDYYSLGVTLYELFLGKRPFPDGDSLSLIHCHIAQEPPLLHERDQAIPPCLSMIVAKLMAKGAEQRYQSIIGLCHDLDLCLDAVERGRDMTGFVPGTADVSQRFILPDRLYGRAAELDRLKSAHQAARSGGTAIVMVKGMSGVGKSKLIAELRPAIEGQAGLFVFGKCDQFRRNLPYHAIIQAFQSLLGQILAGSEDDVATWRTALQDALGENGQVIVEVMPDLRHIIGHQPPILALPPHEAQTRFHLCFTNFVRLFGRPGAPLVLVIDDLQWADSATLGLLENLGTDPGCRDILVVGSYRSNEVDAAHPLRQTLDRLIRSGERVEEIELALLSDAVVERYVADTLGRSDDEIAKLAAVIARKTAGNPFFMRRLLTGLNADGLIVRDDRNRSWVWDQRAIESVSISDNVALLMLDHIRRLDEEAKRLLEIAACIGAEFTLSDLSAVTGQDWDKVARLFRPALTADLVAPIGDEYRFYGGDGAAEPGQMVVRYRFQHDRIQQAAYDLLPEQDKADIHAKAGLFLLGSCPADQLDDRLFDIVDHLNRAIEQLTDTALRQTLAKLNLKAAIKAKNSIAYEPALAYAQAAERFLNGWTATDLWVPILLEQAECSYLAGDETQALALFDRAGAAARDQAEQAAVLESVIHFHTNRGAFGAAYETGRKALALLGVNLPARFVPPLFAADFLLAKWRMRGKSVADLIDLPLCREPRPVMAMRLIGALLKAAYQIRPELCVACATKAVNLSLVHGTTEDNAVAFLVFGGIFIGGVTGDHARGYAFGQLALAMNERYPNPRQRAEINFVSAYFTHFWLKPVAETEKFYRTAYEVGMQTGDFFHLACAACTLVESQFLRGVPLADIEHLASSFLPLLERINSVEAAGAIEAVRRTARNLAGQTPGPDSFDLDSGDEEAFIARLNGFTSQHFAHFYFVNKMAALYLWGRTDQAALASRRSAGYLRHSIAMWHTVAHHFYAGLIACAPGAGRDLRTARRAAARLARWARTNPANFLPLQLLVQAEIARAAGKPQRATLLYGRALLAAETSGFPHILALGHERTGRHMAEQGLEVAARAHLREAYYGYTLWGAEGIAGRLAAEFPVVRTPLPEEAATARPRSRSRSASRSTPSTDRGSDLDLDTVIKSTQAIAGQINADQLPGTLVTILAENVGAERACFVRPDQGRPIIEVDNSGQCAPGPASPLGLPLSVIHFVSRTGQGVLVNDALGDDRFRADPYVIRHQPRSILCVPVLRADEVRAVIYLENRLAADVFTAERLELVDILASQAAIALENAQLYASLEHRVAERTAELEQASAQLREANEALERLTYTDALTQVSNKRHFDKVYQEEWRRAARSGQPLSLMLIDIDHFKKFNDTYGHVEGDECLRRVAAQLRSAVGRPGDVLARFGGEEFAIILPDTRLEDAARIAQRLVEDVHGLDIPHAASTTAPCVTISIGIAEAFSAQADSPVSLIEAADKALYRAKADGRNRICQDDLPQPVQA